MNKNNYSHKADRKRLFAAVIPLAAVFFLILFALSDVKIFPDNVSSDNPESLSGDEIPGDVTTHDAVSVPGDKYGTCYEVFVYSFCDSDGDGIGDLKGLIHKLDYINDGDPSTSSDLGCNWIWLMPVCPSPSYHKYDVTDYCDIDRQYGTIDDYDALITECHKRGIRVINDMVMNHTSSEHPWFKEAASYIRSLGENEEPDPSANPYVSYYNFSREKKEGYEPLSGSGWYYEARFWSGMPDLNLDNPSVHKEFADITDFWTQHGCDGFRMDAVTSYYTGDTTSSTDALSKFISSAKAANPDVYTVAEAWTDSGTYAKYYGSGIDSMFDFDFSGSEGIIARTARGKYPLTRFIEDQTAEEKLFDSYSRDHVNAPFYTNHDMARSAGYYIGRGSSSSVKMAGALNLIMSGNAFVYYGEELGMRGSGQDENKRAPMQWDEPGSEGMCKGPSGMDSIEHNYGTLKEQAGDPSSVYSFYRDAIRMRNLYPAISRGDITQVFEGSGDRIAVYRKTVTDSNSPFFGDDVIIAICTDSSESTIRLADDHGYSVSFCICASGAGNAAVTDGSVLTMPSMSIAILSEGDHGQE